MRLPHIPNAASMAGMGIAPSVDEVDIDCILAAAWPHLYAAALRHAADTVDASTESDSDWATANGSFWRGRVGATLRLRRMADDAVSVTEAPPLRDDPSLLDHAERRPATNAEAIAQNLGSPSRRLRRAWRP